MSRRAARRTAALIGALLLLAAGAGCRRADTASGPPALSLDRLLGGAPAAGFARALAPREFRFPADHGPHPAFRTEWWYFTGNLKEPGGRRFGYQLTLFRSALAAAPPARASAWATRDAYMAHLAVTDVAGGRFHAFERFSRGALGLAGARRRHDGGVRAWLEDWSIEGPPFRLRAAEPGVGIDLRLEVVRPPVLQGEAGLSRKGAEPGNASYYYSLTRLPTRGSVTVDGQVLEVAGLSWMDREWSTSALEAGQQGWDWFALQLDDGRDLMYYRLRREEGTTDRHSAGVMVGPGGAARTLAAGDVQLEERGAWRSPATGILYPAGWRLGVPGEELSLAVRPLLAAQEHTGAIRYWEGAVGVAGTARGVPLTGHGYAELAGYGPPRP